MATTTPLRLQAASLREWIVAQASKESKPATVPNTFQIVDVRDDDFVGGSIPGTLNIPSRRFGSKVDALVEELKDHEAVVFTCALSQQRGPNAAQKYLNRVNAKGIDGQKVYVLQNGFYGWQEQFGKDKTLTENWDREFWETYM